MSKLVLLVSMDKLTQLTALSPNLDILTVRPNIFVAQTQFQQIVGDGQYFELVNKIENSTALTSSETELMEYAQNFLVWQAALESTINIFMKMVNNGITSGTDGDGRRSASIEEVKFLRSMLTNRAEIYRHQLQEYIRINLGSFPLIASSNSNQVVRSDRWQNYFAGIHLDRKAYNSAWFYDNNIAQYSELRHTDPPGCDW
jgi:hypothetical protein